MKENDIIISSRIRLARNLSKFPFPNMMNSSQKERVRELVVDAVVNSNSYFSSNFDVINLEEYSKDALLSLVEEHMISPEFALNTRGKGLILSKDKTISIMINEEDHVRIQVIKEGLSINECLELADKVDILLYEKLDIAFSKKLGYLTQCPTNLGTGLRASLMMHLVALSEGTAIISLSQKLSKLGISVRGMFGEGSKAIGDVFQISNQISLGISEESAVKNLQAISSQLIAEEIKLRQILIKNIATQDKISRSLGILKNAKVLSFSEYAYLASYIKLGISLNVIDGISISDVDKLSVKLNPMTLSAAYSLKDSKQRDERRAKIVSESFKNIL